MKGTCVVGAAIRKRGVQSAASLGPAWGGRDSPDGEACREPFRGPGGPEQHMVHVERVPAWLQERL